MKTLNLNQRKTSNASPSLSAAASTFVLAAAMSLFAASSTTAHSPLTWQDGSTAIDESLMGDPKTSGLAGNIETLIVDGAVEQKLGKSVSSGALEAARLAYAQAVFEPLWTRESAEKLQDLNQFAQDHGFASGLSDEALTRLINARFSGSAMDRADADIALTSLWLKTASRLSAGLSDEGDMVRSTTNRPTRSDLVTALHQLGDSDPLEIMDEFSSQAPQYLQLKQSLRDYRDLARQGAWMKIRDSEDMLEPGMEDPRVPALRKRLKAEGFEADDPFTVPPINPSIEGLDYPFMQASATVTPMQSDTYYDDALVESVKAFQAAHGLAQDGVLGPATLAALNESVESKINRIQLAMDHWRNDANLGERYIWVNIPSYRAEAWTGDQLDISMDTIVGKKRTPTTAFSDEIEYVVVNPKWFLPIGLFKRQKLRKLQKDPGYAQKFNYNVFDRASGEQLNPYDIDWTEAGVASRVQMVQTPGPHNALGQLKIIFPNQHAIYLHDTPDRHLFDRDVRALSSGCIRLADPVKMANWLTDGDEGVSTRVFNATLESRQRDRFYLDQHVPVHLTYLPAVVTPDGQTEFPADIYQRFNAPTLAKGTYQDDISEEQERDLFVGMNGNLAEGGPTTRDLR